jgi:hypothetical protein
MSQPQGLTAAGRIMGNCSCDLPVCGTMLRPTAPFHMRCMSFAKSLYFRMFWTYYYYYYYSAIDINVLLTHLNTALTFLNEKYFSLLLSVQIGPQLHPVAERPPPQHAYHTKCTTIRAEVKNERHYTCTLYLHTLPIVLVWCLMKTRIKFAVVRFSEIKFVFSINITWEFIKYCVASNHGHSQLTYSTKQEAYTVVYFQKFILLSFMNVITVGLPVASLLL